MEHFAGRIGIILSLSGNGLSSSALLCYSPFIWLSNTTHHKKKATKSLYLHIKSLRDFGEFLLDSTVVRSFRAQLAPGYLNLSFLLLFWVFVSASVLGLALEDVFHVLVYGGYESRAGFVWGPFSPIYGVGAVALTLFLNRFYYTHDLVIFLVAMVVGASLEYGASWMMETFWHAIAWDYTGTFGSINGRTNFFFGVMWGTLGLFWVRFVLPIIKGVQKRFSNKSSKAFKVISWLLVVFILVDAVMTVLVLHREGQRTQGIPPATQIDVMLDDVKTTSALSFGARLLLPYNGRFRVGAKCNRLRRHSL